jgi:RimJ/RimL family protein N-acetyltransferase
MLLKTHRLVLREFRADDFDTLYDLQCRPESVRFEPDKDANDVRDYIEKALEQAQNQPRTHFRFAITIRPDDTVRGFIGLALNIAEIRDWEIGWFVHPDEWGKGYATEAARRVMDFAFNELDVHRMIAFCNAGNAASERVMQKLGMRHEATMLQTRLLRGQWCDELLYAILEKEWPGAQAD